MPTEAEYLLLCRRVEALEERIETIGGDPAFDFDGMNEKVAERLVSLIDSILARMRESGERADQIIEDSIFDEVSDEDLDERYADADARQRIKVFADGIGVDVREESYAMLDGAAVEVTQTTGHDVAEAFAPELASQGVDLSPFVKRAVGRTILTQDIDSGAVESKLEINGEVRLAAKDRFSESPGLGTEWTYWACVQCGARSVVFKNEDACWKDLNRHLEIHKCRDDDENQT